ncbi:MAG: Gfo/Idh/MocA family oxidoreductase [Planctomycetes bacterium]|nr:Gfo/Idh/MocA family oxidoreductase [Planctomycetota bacterium]
MVKAGFIGVGGIVSAHLNYLKTRQDVQIVAMCDINKANLDRRVKEYGGRPYADFRQMLDKEKPDAVWICTPPQVRREPLVACAERDIPVFCEKPVERSAEAGDKIAAELARLKARVQIGYVFRAMPVIRKFRELSADDSIHLIHSFYACGIGLDRCMPAWFYKKELSGGALIDQATHNLDLLRSLFGEVVQVQALASNPVCPRKAGYTIEEVITLNFLFRNGSAGSHIHTWVGDAWRNEMAFSGEKRHYRLDPGAQKLTVLEGRKKHNYDLGGGSIYVHQNEVFLRQAQTGDWSTNPCDYADGLATLKLTLACDQAAASGRIVKLQARPPRKKRQPG